jgi:hypothetical protein
MSATGGRLAPPDNSGRVKPDSERHVRHTPYLLFILAFPAVRQQN